MALDTTPFKSRSFQFRITALGVHHQNHAGLKNPEQNHGHLLQVNQRNLEMRLIHLDILSLQDPLRYFHTPS